jgi:putative tryptophan/tyrosine transport system substrate-binding protein
VQPLGRLRRGRSSECRWSGSLEVAHPLASKAAAIAVLLNPSNPNVDSLRLAELRAAGSTLGREVHILNAASQQFDAVFASVVHERIGAVVVANDTLLTS